MESVILINYPGKKGGGAAYAYQIAEALVKNNQKIVAILSSDVENKSKWESLETEKIIYIKTYHNYFEFIFRIIFWFVQKRKIKNELKKYHIKSIYVPMEQPFTRKINKIINKKVILTVHDVDPHSGDNKITALIGKFLNRGLRKKSENVLLLSKTFVDRYSVKYKYDKARIRVVRHGLFFQYMDNKTIKPPVNNSNLKYNILFFGRISYYKGIDILLQAYKKLEDRLNLRLSIIGSGDLSPYQSLIGEIKSINIVNEWIKDDNIQSYFSEPNTLLIVPYRDATQSGVISLANLFRIPVIASNTGGLTEQVSHMNTGLIFENCNIDDLVDKIKYAVENSKNLIKLTENAYNETSNLWNVAANTIIELSNDNKNEVIR